MKGAYQDLQGGGGSPTEIAQALANWMVIGFKEAVEDALEVIMRLFSRSSRNLAQNERASLEPDACYSGGSDVCADYTLPQSQRLHARHGWRRGSIPADLDCSVGSNPVSSKWKAYLANRNGDVWFNYIALHCLRPWFTPSLYGADDWKLSSQDGVVSKDGVKADACVRGCCVSR